MSYAGAFISKMYLLSGIDWSMSIKLEHNVVFVMLLGITFSYDWRSMYKKVCVGIVRKMRCKKLFLVQKVLGIVMSIFFFVISVASIMSSSHNPFIYFRF